MKVVAELLRTTVTAAVFAELADQAGALDLPAGAALALLAWLGFPLVLLTGSVLWEQVPPVTAALHAGDWLLKLFLIALVIGLLH